MVDKPPEMDEIGILRAINEVLGLSLRGRYARLEDVPYDKLYRVYLLLSIEALLREHPEIRVFMCHPSETGGLTPPA